MHTVNVPSPMQCPAYIISKHYQSCYDSVLNIRFIYYTSVGTSLHIRHCSLRQHMAIGLSEKKSSSLAKEKKKDPKNIGRCKIKKRD